MKKVIGVLLVAIAVMLVVQGAGWGVVPEMITFQGRLTDASGNPVTATQKYKFSLRNAETSGTEIWAMSKVFTPNSNGVFEVNLTGGVPELSTVDLSSAGGIWLEIYNVYTSSTIGIQQLKSVPFALLAKKVDIPLKMEATSTKALIEMKNNGTGAGGTFTSTGGPGVIGAGPKIGVLGMGVSPTLLSDIAMVTPYGVLAGVSGFSNNMPAVGAMSVNHYGVYARTESTDKPAIGAYAPNSTGIIANGKTYGVMAVSEDGMGIVGVSGNTIGGQFVGKTAAVKGEVVGDEYHFGVLGAAAVPYKAPPTGFPLIISGVIKAGVYGQLNDGKTRGYIGYLNKTSSTALDSTGTTYGGLFYNSTGVGLKVDGMSTSYPAIEALSNGNYAVSATSTTNTAINAYSESGGGVRGHTSTGAWGVRGLNDSGGYGGYFNGGKSGVYANSITIGEDTYAPANGLNVHGNTKMDGGLGVGGASVPTDGGVAAAGKGEFHDGVKMGGSSSSYPPIKAYKTSMYTYSGGVTETLIPQTTPSSNPVYHSETILGIIVTGLNSDGSTIVATHCHYDKNDKMIHASFSHQVLGSRALVLYE